MGLFKNFFKGKQENVKDDVKVSGELKNEQDDVKIPEDLAESSKKMGERLGVLINTFFSPDDQPGILEALDNMSPEEVMDFYENLEKRFKEFSVKYNEELDANYDKGVEQIKIDHEERSAAINNEAIDALGALDEEISKK